MSNRKTKRFVSKTIETLPKLHKDKLIELSISLLNDKAFLYDLLETLPIAMIVYSSVNRIYSNSLFDTLIADIPTLILDHTKTGVIYIQDIFKKDRLLDIEYVGYEKYSVFYIDDIYKKYDQLSSVKTMQELDALEKLAAGISHEIKNPLTAIDVHTQYLQSKLAKSSIKVPDEIVNYINIVQKESARLLAILDIFLNMVRKNNPPFSFTEIEDIIHNVRRIFSEELLIKQISLEIKIAIVPKIFTSTTIIQQILSDLLRNAIEAMDLSERKILYIHVSEDVCKKFIVISVGDSGEGIPKSIRYSMFNPYFTTKKDGIGLGLTFVKKMITEIGGSVSVGDSIYKGAEFQIYLPITQGQKNLPYPS